MQVWYLKNLTRMLQCVLFCDKFLFQQNVYLSDQSMQVVEMNNFLIMHAHYTSVGWSSL